MCKSIALLSGKGGSGKTTLALSMASMLSSCGVKVLLVDCDLSTNGATFFYEEKLSAKKNKITSFFDLLFNENNSKLRCVPINENYDFIPSVTQITKKTTKTYTYKNDSRFSLYGDLCQKYEVILFDCQAGYTDILKLILPYMDVNLIVMESDAISSAAMRSLFLKIGDIINEKKVYQVFNKASKEEYEIYSKVSGGTVFVNIETIMFDWKIRKAFAVSQIPDLANTSVNYGTQIFNICKILFPADSILNKLNKYETVLFLHSYQEHENQLKETIARLRRDYSSKKSRTSKIMAMLLPLVCAITLCVAFMFALREGNTINRIELMIAPIMVGLLTVAFSIANIFEITKEKREHDNEVGNYREQLFDVQMKKRELQKRLDEAKESA